MNLSIIIVNFNTRELLRKCLHSVIGDLRLAVREKGKVFDTPPITNRQPPITEIIVVDNGSEDDSIKMINKFRKLTNSNSKSANSLTFKLIENKENLGFAKAVNQALRQACTERSRSTQGKVILLLNSDTKVKQGALEKLLEFEKKVRPAIIGLKMLNPNGSDQGSVFNLPTAKRAIEEFWLGRKGSFSKFTPDSETPMLVEAVSGGAMAISREVVDKIGLLDERYFMYFEDLDYCRRAKAKGIKVWYLPEAEVFHEHGASGIADLDNQQRRLISSSKIYHGIIVHYLINIIIRVGCIFKNR